MKLLHAQPVSRYEDDGMRAVYECQNCYETYEGIFDPYDLHDEIPCTRGCPDEEGDES